MRNVVFCRQGNDLQSCPKCAAGVPQKLRFCGSPDFKSSGASTRDGVRRIRRAAKPPTAAQWIRPAPRFLLRKNARNGARAPGPRSAPQLEKTQVPSLCALGVGSKAGAEVPGLGRFKRMRSLREEGNRDLPSLKRLFGAFLAVQKGTRGPGPGRPQRLQVCTDLRPGPQGPTKSSPPGGARQNHLRS